MTAGPVVAETPQLGDTFTQTTPTARKIFRWAARDNLASRNRIGRPGSKRYQRYINRSFLGDLGSEGEMELDFRMMESTSPFSILFEESNRKKWDPFVEVTEEKQEKLLISIEITTRQKGRI